MPDNRRDRCGRRYPSDSRRVCHHEDIQPFDLRRLAGRSGPETFAAAAHPTGRSGSASMMRRSSFPRRDQYDMTADGRGHYPTKKLT